MLLRRTKWDWQRKLATFHPKITSIISHIERKLNLQKLKSTVSEYIIYNAYITHLACRSRETLMFGICLSFFVYLGKDSDFYIPRSAIWQGKWLKRVVNHHIADRSIHCILKSVAISSFVFVFNKCTLKYIGSIYFTNPFVHDWKCSRSHPWISPFPRGE